jgi:hypothetical protein
MTARAGILGARRIQRELMISVLGLSRGRFRRAMTVIAVSEMASEMDADQRA